eukprot:6183175-Pleurochrysis_carterae.AAC.6
MAGVCSFGACVPLVDVLVNSSSKFQSSIFHGVLMGKPRPGESGFWKIGNANNLTGGIGLIQCAKSFFQGASLGCSSASAQ